MGMSMFAKEHDARRSERIIYTLGGGFDLVFACEKTTRKADGRWFDVRVAPLEKNTFYCVSLIGCRIVEATRYSDIYAAIFETSRCVADASSGLPKCIIELVVGCLYTSGFADDQM